MKPQKSLPRQTILILASLIVSWMLGFSPAQALTFGSGDKVQYSSLHRIDGDLVAAASNFTNEGTIEGDLIVTGYRITNSGEISGSILSSAYEFDHRGKVGGSIRALGYLCEIDGFVERSVIALGGETIVTGRAVIRRDLVARGGLITVNGTVLGNADLAGEVIEISGQIDGDLKLEGKKIRILPPAVIGGDLTYNSSAEFEIDSLGGVTVLGQTIVLEPDESDQSDAGGFLAGLIGFFAELLGAFVFGAILMSLFRRQTNEACRQIRQRLSVVAATGFLTVAVCLLSLIVMFGSILAALIGFSMISGNSAIVGAILIILATIMIPITSFASISGGILFYSGSIVLSIAIGYLVIGAFKPEIARINKTHLFVGLLILFASFELPYAGLVLFLVGSMLGAGSIVLGIRHCHQNSANQQPAPLQQPSAPPETPPEEL